MMLRRPDATRQMRKKTNSGKYSSKMMRHPVRISRLFVLHTRVLLWILKFKRQIRGRSVERGVVGVRFVPSLRRSFSLSSCFCASLLSGRVGTEDVQKSSGLSTTITSDEASTLGIVCGNCCCTSRGESAGAAPQSSIELTISFSFPFKSKSETRVESLFWPIGIVARTERVVPVFDVKWILSMRNLKLFSNFCSSALCCRPAVPPAHFPTRNREGSTWSLQSGYSSRSFAFKAQTRLAG